MKIKRPVMIGIIMTMVSIMLPASILGIRQQNFDTRNYASDSLYDLTVCPAQAEGCTYVGGDGIQKAVNQAQNGEVILIKKGVYTRSEPSYFSYVRREDPKTRYIRAFVDLGDKEITITGEGIETILDGKASSEMVAFASKSNRKVTINLQISGFKQNEGAHGDMPGCDFNKAKTDCSPGDAFKLEESSVTVIDNVHMVNNRSGISINANAQLDISNSVIKGSKDVAIFAGDKSKVTATNIILYKNKKSSEEEGSGAISLFDNSYLSLSYSILYANEFDKDKAQVAEGCGVGKTTYNDGASILEVDPIFLSEEDFHLKAGSPAIDKGNPAIKEFDGSTGDIGLKFMPADASKCNWLNGCDAIGGGTGGGDDDDDDTGGGTDLCTDVNAPISCKKYISDVNNDKRVTLDDYSNFIDDFLAFKREDKYNPRSDMNGDKSISVTDYSLFITNFLNAKRENSNL